MAIPASLSKLDGEWRGINRLWLMPSQPERVSEAAARVDSAARGQFFRLAYTWAEDGQQEGLLLLSQAPDEGRLTAAWIDSWHMAHQVMLCSGQVGPDGRVSVLGSYAAPPGPDWGWRISLGPGPGERFRLVMHNITPDGAEALAVEVEFTRAA